METKRNNPNIKVKLLLGYSITLLALIVAGVVTYFSFTRLIDSVEVLSEPDVALIRLNHMLTDISEAEGNFRSYILSDDKAHLNEYQQRLDSIKQNIARLKKDAYKVPAQSAKLDSISTLIDAKYDALDQLAALKKRSRNSSFSSKALEKIRQAPDSAKIDTTLTTYTETTTHLKPKGIIDEEEKQPESKGLFQSIKNLFSSKEDSEDEETEEDVEADEEELYTETTVRVDTSVVSFYQSDTVLTNVKRILFDMQQRENRLNSLLNSKELEILNQDRLIMEKLRIIVTDLEREEILRAERQTQEAKAIADKFSYTILAIGLFSLFVGSVFVFLILHDINKSNFYKLQLEKAKNKAEQLAKAKEEFLSNMSHEIRTPLNAILGFTAQLLPTSLQPTQREYLQAVHQSSEHLLSTVNDILDYSKLEAGKLTIEHIPFRPQTAIQDVHKLLKLKAEEKHLNFQYFIDEDCPEALLGDPFRLKQILFNLVGNSLKFTNEGHVYIICRCRKAFSSPKKVILTIEVKDTGIGISKEKQSLIFEGFQQADSSTTRRYGGTGLGLSICKNLTDLQHGALTVESEEGKGSSFIINIPYELCEVEKVETHQHTTSFSPNLLSGLKFLIVDDDNFNILLLEAILKKYGAETMEARNAPDGIALVSKNRFDALITDIQMPQMSGFEFSKNVRANHSSIPILALSAHVTEKEVNLAKTTGISAIISKPFKESCLIEKVATLLDLKTADISNSTEAEETTDLNSALYYDLSSFDNFIKGDKNALVSLLTTLIRDQKKNLTLLKRYTNEKDLSKIAEVAHKMNASFAYLRANEIVVKLQKLERGIRTEHTLAPSSAISLANSVLTDGEKLVEKLEAEVLQLKSATQPA